MSRFPGTIYSADGRALSRRGAGLITCRLMACEHRWLMRREVGAVLAQVWLLADDATVEFIPWMTWQTTMGGIWYGEAILLIAPRPEPVVSLRKTAAAVMGINEMTIRKAVGA